MELPDTTWYSHVFTNHIEVSKVSCLQWHVPSIELNMQLRDILNHLKPTAEAAVSTSVFVHLIWAKTLICVLRLLEHSENTSLILICRLGLDNPNLAT